MYLLLLAFGGVLSAAGVALTAAGVSLHDHTFDTTIVTPGVVAIVGGLLLIGLGLALRVLQRIERTLVLRQVLPAESASEPTLIPLSKLPSHHTAPSLVSSQDKRVENLPGQPPASVRLETPRTVEEAELSVSPAEAPPLPTSVDVAVAEAEKTHATKRKNGAVPGRITPRLDMNLRVPSAANRPAGPSFDALWTKGPRSIRAAPPIPAEVVSAPAAELETAAEPAAAPVQTPAADAAAPPEPVAVLKSGVVDGMAYTLYSDGSIEAQLPQGTLRFGSITELRNHIEQSA
jgi:hypothetical protein